MKRALGFTFWCRVIRSFCIPPRHPGVLQGRPAGSPGGDEGRASGQSPDAAAGGRPRQNHEAGAAEDDGEKVENRSRRLWTRVENPFFL